MLLEAAKSCLLVVDVQPRLLKAMDAPRQVVAGCSLMMKAAEVLDVPVIVSEQYPEGLGPTVEPLAELAPADGFFPKLDFSCARNTAIRGKIDVVGRPQIVIAGIEAHVCVLQTAVDLQREGFACFVAADATSSRMAANHAAAMARMRGAGVEVVTSEMVVFEWLGRAGTPQFKELNKLLR